MVMICLLTENLVLFCINFKNNTFFGKGFCFQLLFLTPLFHPCVPPSRKLTNVLIYSCYLMQCLCYFFLAGLWIFVTNNELFFCSFSGLLSMQWTAEGVTLNPALSQCGRPVRWWMTAELKVLSPFDFLISYWDWSFFISILCSCCIVHWIFSLKMFCRYNLNKTF